MNKNKLDAEAQAIGILLDIRALLYLTAIRTMSQGHGQVVDQFAPDVDAALVQVRKRLED